MGKEDWKPELIPSEESFFRKYKVSFDHDGVIAFSKAPVVEEYNRLYGTNHTVLEIRDFRTITKWTMKDLGVDEEEALKIDNHLWYERPDLLLKAEPMPGAARLTKWLADRKIFFPIITSRSPDFLESTLQWYRKNFPWVKEDQIYIRKEGQEGISGDTFKAHIIRKLEIDYHFEDALHHAKRIINSTNAKVFLLNSSSELDYLTDQGLIRVRTGDGQFPTIQDVLQRIFQ